MCDDKLANETSSEEVTRCLLQAYYDATVGFENTIGLIIPTIFTVVVLVGLVGNSLVIFIIGWNIQMRNSTNTLIIGLACSDLLFLTFCVPFTAADYALPVWIFPTWWCTIMNYLQFISAYASVWTLVLMATDRFLAVVFPIASITWRTMKNAARALVLLWAFLAICCIPLGLQHGVFTYYFIKEWRSTCVVTSHATRNATPTEVQIFFGTFNVFGFFLPITIICVLYFFMLRRLWFTSRPGNNASCARNDAKSSTYSKNGITSKRKADSFRVKKKVALMILGVILTFILCWLPLNICFLVTGVRYPKGPTTKTEIILQICAQVLAYTNSCLNPILYAFLSENFRKGFISAFGCLFCTKPRLVLQYR